MSRHVGKECDQCHTRNGRRMWCSVCHDMVCPSCRGDEGICQSCEVRAELKAEAAPVMNDKEYSKRLNALRAEWEKEITETGSATSERDEVIVSLAIKCHNTQAELERANVELDALRELNDKLREETANATLAAAGTIIYRSRGGA